MNANPLACHFGDLLLFVAAAAVACALGRKRLRTKHKLAVGAWASIAMLGLYYNIKLGPTWAAPLGMVGGFAVAALINAVPLPPRSRF